MQLVEPRQQIDSLQIVRFAAASAVFSIHFFRMATNQGWIRSNPCEFAASGVDIFFVLSGFLIAHNAHTETSALRFMTRRVIRIVPLYWLLTILLYCASALFPGLLRATDVNIGTLISSLLFIPETRQNGGVFPLVYTGWTLNYEMFFYIIIALSLVVPPRFRLGAVGAGISLFVALGQVTPFESVSLRYWSNGIILEFVFGIVVFEVYRLKPEVFRWPWISLLMGASLLVLQEGDEAMPNRVLVWGLPAALVIAGAVGCHAMAGRALSLGVLLGDASYALYLVHPYTIRVVEAVVMPRLPVGQATLLLAFALSLLVTALAAVGMHLLIEKPILKSLRNWADAVASSDNVRGAVTNQNKSECPLRSTMPK